MTEGVGQALLAVVALSMATTPAVRLGRPAVFRRGGQARRYPEQLKAATGDLDHHVLVAGFGRVGWTVCKLLERNEVPYVALDFDMEQGAPRADREHAGLFRRREPIGGPARGRSRARAGGGDHARPAGPGRAGGGRPARPRREVHHRLRARDGQHRKRLELAGERGRLGSGGGQPAAGATVLRLSGASESEVDESLAAFRRNGYALLDELLEQRQQKTGEPKRDDPAAGSPATSPPCAATAAARAASKPGDRAEGRARRPHGPRASFRRVAFYPLSA
ncbi:MAG: hypothetical protein U5L08_06520 [Xanthomonadales bacterium]|nr:hypothetical protein [Xanthomonadales bacterium]